MMSRAAYMMQDHIRRSYAYITDVALPSVFLCRGRLAFPQGLTAISIWFHRRNAADLYAHPYFIEKQSNPDQPSPQMHTTEELQGILKVMQGLQYMRDDFSKLDNTLCVMTDYDVQAEGRMLCFESETGVEPSEAEGHREVKRRRESLRQEGSPSRMPNSLSAEKLHEAPAKPSRVSFPTTTEVVRSAEVSWAYFEDVWKAHQNSLSNTPSPATGRANSLTAKEGFSTTLNQPRWQLCKGAYTVLYNPCEVNERTFVELLQRLRREHRVVAALVVPTRQTWREVQLWADAFPDAKIFSSTTIPLEGTAEGLERIEKMPSRTSCGSYQDLGNGVMGIVFPEVEPDEERLVEAPAEGLAGERHTSTHPEKDEEEEKKKRLRSHSKIIPSCAVEASEALAHIPASPQQRSYLRQPNRGRPRESGGTVCRAVENFAGDTHCHNVEESSVNKSETKTLCGFIHGEDPADAIWDASVAPLFHATDAPRAGLRISDGGRVEELSTNVSSSTASAAIVSHGTGSRLTPQMELLLVPGDVVAQEFVLYHHQSGVLACVELFHGAYSDFDGVNSWLCRVWFKFMRQGNHKNDRRVPRFKWRQVTEVGGLRRLQAWLDHFTRTHVIRAIVSAHGTQPVTQDAANVLRQQWNLPPLCSAELPTRPVRGSMPF